MNETLPFATADDPLLAPLNNEQRQAVLHGEGPLVIFAVAGSGKTRVLTHRIAHLIDRRRVEPYEILAVTFTNKAADEMRRRLSSMLGPRAYGLWVGTFHATCARILREHGEAVGLSPRFSIYDDSDQRALLKDIYRRLDLDPKAFDPRIVASLLDEGKNNLVAPSTLAERLRPPARDWARTIVSEYEKALRENNAVDFGDLLVMAVRALESSEAARTYYSRRFRHVLVDEFQDTNFAQKRFIELILNAQGNLCVVGDDDQSIYRWRGANIENILEFESHFPGARRVILGRNYRSSSNILAVAGSIIKHNRGRVAKALITDNEAGARVRLFRADSEYDEGRFVAAQVLDLIKRQGLSASDIAVFYRVNALSRVLEEELMRAGVPFIVVGGTRFYDRKEIKDILAYLRLAVNPADGVSAKRVINVPSRKIGAKSIEAIDIFAARDGVSFLEAARAALAEDSLPKAAREGVLRFLEVVEAITKKADDAPVPEVIQYAIEHTGYLAMLMADPSVEALSRKENLGELHEAGSQFARRNPDLRLADYLEQVSLAQDADLVTDENEAVRLMTLHNAKGLEFPAVFMVGLEEKLLPHARAMDGGNAEIEEERRLCYVGVTRARRHLTLSCAARRRTYSGEQGYSRPSRFLDEIPDDLIEPLGFSPRPSLWEMPGAIGSSPGGAAPERAVFRRPPSFERTRQPFASDWKPGRPSNGAPQGGANVDIPGEGDTYYDYTDTQEGAGYLAPGMRVTHQKFGAGRVLALNGQGDAAKVIVRFEGGVGTKTMLLKFANLTRK
ncbi:UvrD-helicase domain-containing protein [bacterium]|nr:UvrD-helicase domain-containing protein [bacterium]